MTDDKNNNPVVPNEPEGSVTLNDNEGSLSKSQSDSVISNECEKSLSELNKAKQERDEYKNNWLRALADYQNLQKETVARRVEWAQMSERQILEDFIPIYENLKAAVFCHSREGGNPDSWLDGIKNVIKQFQTVLKEHGVEEIKTVGEKFNPNLHEAMGYEDPSTMLGTSATLRESDVIIKEISGGYKMGDKAIKAAKVIVAK